MGWMEDCWVGSNQEEKEKEKYHNKRRGLWLMKVYNEKRRTKKKKGKKGATSLWKKEGEKICFFWGIRKLKKKILESFYSLIKSLSIVKN